MKLPLIGLFTLLLAAIPQAARSETSALWGENGEAWSATSRLPDFRLAGYACGREPVPDYPVLTSVKEHGAKGDGITDDTEAFRSAVLSVGENGAVLVPSGRYVITDVIEIRRSGVVLRGEGPEKSVLVLPRPLSEIRPLASVDQVKAAYSFTGGFVVLRGTDKGALLSKVVEPAKRGDRVLVLAGTDGLKPGDWIRLVMKDPPDHSLLRHLHADLLDPGTDTPNLKPVVDWAARITSVDGPKVTMNRPLRLDVRPEWNPEVYAMAPTLRGSGLENLGFAFPGEPKRPHLQEAGYNAIQFIGAVDCWIRNVTVTDADNGVIVNGSRFCTVDQFSTKAEKRTGLTGHHALWATSRTQDVLFINFRFGTRFVHDLTVEGFANGNVFAKGSGVEINCDHHRNAPYENLFTDIDAGNPRRLFQSSGRGDRGPHSGARTTFWGIRGQGPFPGVPPAADWPLINLVGFGEYPRSEDPAGPWIEPGSGGMRPSNLWEAQAAIR